MEIKAAGQTSVGRKRRHNEDYFLVTPELGLYLVCDGMGGHAAGDVAAETAAVSIARHLVNHRSTIERFNDTPHACDRLVRLVEEALQTASHDVFRVATSNRGHGGMGTTATMILVAGSKAFMGHVGDSRLYIMRAGQLHMLSEDHTWVHEMVRRGVITYEEGKDNAYAHTLTRAVGVQETVHADTLVFDILPGDLLLLCSDGLSRYFEDGDELAQALKSHRLDELPAHLISLANDRGGRDNITAVVVQAGGDEVGDAASTARMERVNLHLHTLKYVSLFQHLTLRELVRVLNQFEQATYRAGDVVLREGDEGECLFVVVEGDLSVMRGGHELARLQRGTHFGEMALFNNRPRSATVIAKTDTQLLMLERSRFNELILREPSLAVKLLWSFAQELSLRLDEASGQMYGSKRQTGRFDIFDSAY